MGFGGMGAVYEAVQRNMNRRIALKYIPSHDPVTAARFEREALTVSQLRHPNTVTVFDYGQTDDGFLFLSMELLSGRTLTELIKNESPLPPDRVVHIASQICRSLAEAHEMGIVHRDVKPDNVILIEVDGDPDVTKVLDFGIAKAVEREDEETLTGDGRIVGTPRYMSPEQILSEDIDHRSDIYSLGCIIFEMLCGAPPFKGGSTTALMISHAQDPPPPFAQRLADADLDAIPHGLEQVVRRAMAKSPWERPQDTDELREDLEEALRAHHAGRAPAISSPARSPAAEAPSLSQPKSVDDLASSPDSSESSRSAQMLIVGGLATGAAVALVVVGVMVLTGDDEPEEDALEGVVEETEQAPADAIPPSQREDDEAEDPLQPTVVSVTDTVRVRIDSSPSGADIVEDGELIGETPFNLSVSPEEGVLEYQLTRRGYRNKDVSVELDNDAGETKELAFDLERRPRRPVAQPAPAPVEEEDDEPAIQLLLD